MTWRYPAHSKLMKRIACAMLATLLLLMINGSRIAPRESPNPHFGPGSGAGPEPLVLRPKDGGRNQRDPGRAELDLLELHAIATPSAQSEDPIQQGETRTTATVWIWGEHGWEKRKTPPKTPIAIYWYNDYWVRIAPAETPQYIQRDEVFIFGVDVYTIYLPIVSKCAQCANKVYGEGNKLVRDGKEIHFPIVSKCDQCANKVHRDGNKLVRNGKEIRLIGVNATWLTRGSDFPEEKQDEVLSFLSKYVNCIRVWVLPGADLDKLERLLDLGAKYDLMFGITFETFQEVPEYARFGQWWFDKGYKESYLSFVKEAVSRFKDSPRIAFWQIMNEPNPWGWPWGWQSSGIKIFERWIKDVTAEIRAIDPCHPISIGLISVGKIGNNVRPEKWFKEIHTSTEADLVTAHVHKQDGEQEIDLANEIDYPIVLTEVWFDRTSNAEKRRDWVLEFAEKRLDEGLDGLLLWQFKLPTREYPWKYEITEDEIPVWEVLRRFR